MESHRFTITNFIAVVRFSASVIIGYVVEILSKVMEGLLKADLPGKCCFPDNFFIGNQIIADKT